jgi:hypothetical protein
MAELEGMRERTVIVNSMSKTYSVTGWRVGYCIAPARDHLGDPQSPRLPHRRRRGLERRGAPTVRKSWTLRIAEVIAGGRDAVADAPARHRVGLRHRVDDDGALAHPFEFGHRDVLISASLARVEDVLVDFIREAERVVFAAERGDEFEFVAREDFAGRVVRVADDDGFGALVEAARSSSRSNVQSGARKGT